ncbi:MAG: efflux RND transporter periplasmic adaptor subunit [Myxococcota bacterium]
MNKLSRTLVAIGLFLLIVAAGVGIAVALVKTKPEPRKAGKPKRAVPVEVHVVKTTTQPLAVIANGTVISAREVVLQPEVTGRIVWKSEDLVPGGRIKKGAPLLRIDPRDYATAVEQQKAQLESRKLAYEQEKSRRVIAEREWDLFGDDAGAPDATDALGRALALRKPHLRSAKASLHAAQAALQQSRLALSRTLLSAPFNAFVQSENVDVGQLVSPNAQLARLVGTDTFWIQVSVPVERLPWIKVPGLNAEKGSDVKVMQEVGAGMVEREAKVIRLYGDLDPVGRMARVLVEVPDPMSVDEPVDVAEVREGEPAPPTAMPLLLGAYVRVSIDAGRIEDVMEVPRAALHEGNEVYVVDADNKLRTKRLKVIWRREDTVLVRGGLSSGERVIVSQLATPLEAMDVRIKSGPTAASAGSAGADPNRPEEKAQ